MREKILTGLFLCLLIGIVLLAACYPAKSPKSAVTSANPTAGENPAISYQHWWEEYGTPQYGGNLIVAGDQLDIISFLPVSTLGGQYQLWAESLFGPDWGIDRNTWNYRTEYIPDEYYNGLLAESWAQTGPLTVTVHLRQGVHWWNVPPLNGRELDASDVQFNYDRILGTGSGFTVPGSLAERLSDIERVVATDKYTVEFSMKQVTVRTMQEIFSPLTILPPELAPSPITTSTTADTTDTGTVIIPPSEVSDAIGTGPWIPSDYEQFSSLTLTKNPDYWNSDERYPQNRLPYLDTVKYIAMANDATTEAALRTRKIDVKSDMRGLSWQQVQKLAQTNPELKYIWVPSPGITLELRTDKKPFSDIRVRKALEMAIDRKAIAGSIYGGSVDGTPCGLVSPVYTHYAYTYDQWSPDLKEAYSYNPDKARQLLADADYAQGFRTTVLLASQDEMELLQILGYEFNEIGVTLEFQMMDSALYMATIMSGQQDQIILEHRTGMLGEPDSSLSVRLSSSQVNYTHNADGVYDDLVNRLIAAATPEEAQKLSVEADKYALEQCWAINIFPQATSVLWQSYVKGYSGENLGPYAGFYFARCWTTGK